LLLKKAYLSVKNLFENLLFKNGNSILMQLATNYIMYLKIFSEEA